MTALQDWLSFRPADQYVIRTICRPLRAVLSSAEVDEPPTELKLISPGIERC